MRREIHLAAALVLLAAPFDMAAAKAPPVLSGTAASADGVPIRYQVAGRGEPTLVFVHCGACDLGFWDAQVAHFAQSHRVVTLDLAGHGQSGARRQHWTIPGFGEDVVAVVDALRLKRVVLIGHSLGGPAALEAARRMPDRPAGLVFVDTLVDFERRPSAEEIEGMEAFLKQMQADYKTIIGAYVSQHLFSASTPAAVKERVVAATLAAPPEIGVGAARASVLYDPLPALREIKAPIRAVNSDLFPTNVEGNRKHVPGYQVAIMKGLGHYPMLEQPEAFNTLLAQALRELAAAAGQR